MMDGFLCLIILCLFLFSAQSQDVLINPSKTPRVDKNDHENIIFTIQNEPGGLVQVFVRTEVRNEKKPNSLWDTAQIGEAEKNLVTNEWRYMTPPYYLSDDDTLCYEIFYRFLKGVVRKYRGSVKFIEETAVTAKPAQHPLGFRGKLIMHDEFLGNQLDWTKWWHEVTAYGGGNGEFQMYSPEATNTFIKNGILHLKPTFTADRFGENFLSYGNLDVKGEWGVCTISAENGCFRSGDKNNIPPIMSAKLYSKTSIQYGRIEIVAQLPKGDWIWPGMWMLPAIWPWKYGEWPRSGEIDIIQSRGNMELRDEIGNTNSAAKVYSAIKLGNGENGLREHGSWRLSTANTTWADGFHTYSLDWMTDHIRIDVDGQPILALATPVEGYWQYEQFDGKNIWSSGKKDAPFDNQFGLILNVAVGGTIGYFEDGWVNNDGTNPKPWKDNSATAMMDFWEKKNAWQHTWKGDDVALKIKSVKMFQY